MRVGTVKDVRELLLISENKVYEMAASGELPSLRRVAGRLRFDLDEVEAWLRDTRPSTTREDAA